MARSAASKTKAMSEESRSPGAGLEEQLQIDLFLQAPAWTDALADAETLSRRAAAAALAGAEPGLPLERAELSLVLADDSFVRGLNRDYRNQDKATNVLSFPALEEDLAPEGEIVLGDVILALETCRREAKEQGKSLAAHVSHLVVHGVLHLLGHDHQDEKEAEEMERLEVEILASLGIADPYEGAAGEDV